MKSLLDRFWSKVRQDGPPHPTKPELGACWIWTDKPNKFGYGALSFRRGENPKLAHRVAWELHFGDIGVAQVISQTCKNRMCVNPGHLFRQPRGDQLRSPAEGRFWSKVNKEGPVPAHVPQLGPCWIWTGRATVKGNYGLFNVDGSKNIQRAHRVSWEMHNGSIPDELLVLHRCDNPPCVRPDHLFLGTPNDNTQDMVQKDRLLHGVRATAVKLNEDQVQHVRRLVLQGLSTTQIAAQTQLTCHHVHSIRYNKTWKRLPWPTAPVVNEVLIQRSYIKGTEPGMPDPES